MRISYLKVTKICVPIIQSDQIWIKLIEMTRARNRSVLHYITLQKTDKLLFYWLIPLCSIKDILNNIFKQFSTLKNILKYFDDKCFLILLFCF